MEEGNYMMTRLSPWHTLPQFRELTSEKWEQTSPGAEDWMYLEQSRWCWSDNCMIDFKMTDRVDCAISVCSLFCPLIHPWNFPLKATTHWWSVESWSLATGPPSPQVAVLWDKAIFLSTNFASWVLVLEQWAVRLHFWYEYSYIFIINYMEDMEKYLSLHNIIIVCLPDQMGRGMKWSPQRALLSNEKF